MSEANNAFLSGSRIAAGKGLWPRQHRIEKDSILYRFADTSYREPSQAADGPWWFEFDLFRPSSRVQRELITEQPGQLLVSKMTPMQGILEVYQLYIPGLGYPHFQFHKNFSMLSAEQIPTG